jgi:transposase-like protein
METRMDAKTLREHIAHARQQRRRVSTEVQQAVIAFAIQRQAAGVSWRAIGGELGMSHHTLVFWRDRQRRTTASRLSRVEVVEEEASDVTTHFVVHAGMLRIEQMSVAQLTDLITRLR